jgi:hypothetical protein
MARVLNDTVNQTVNQTINQTAQKTGEASTGILQDPIFIGVIGLAVLVGVVAIITKKVSSNDEDPYEGTTLKQRLKDKQIAPTMEFGNNVSKPVDYGLQELGILRKYYKTTEVTEDGILSDIHNKDPEEDEVNTLLNSENDQFKNLTLVVGPKKFSKKLRARLKSNDPVDNPYYSVYSVPKTSINNGDRLEIDDEKVDWNYSGGIYYSKDVQGITTMYNYSALSLIDDLSNVFSNKGEITQALNEEFANWKAKKEVKNKAFKEFEKMKRNMDSDDATD